MCCRAMDIWSKRTIGGASFFPYCASTGSDGLPPRKRRMPEEKNSAPLSVTIYNPALLKKEDLIRGFVARQPMLDRLLDDLRREAPGSTPQHQLIIGQRGLGKTTLLRRVAFA